MTEDRSSQRSKGPRSLSPGSSASRSPHPALLHELPCQPPIQALIAMALIVMALQSSCRARRHTQPGWQSLTGGRDRRRAGRGGKTPPTRTTVSPTFCASAANGYPQSPLARLPPCRPFGFLWLHFCTSRKLLSALQDESLTSCSANFSHGILSSAVMRFALCGTVSAIPNVCPSEKGNGNERPWVTCLARAG